MHPVSLLDHEAPWLVRILAASFLVLLRLFRDIVLVQQELCLYC